MTARSAGSYGRSSRRPTELIDIEIGCAHTVGDVVVLGAGHEWCSRCGSVGTSRGGVDEWRTPTLHARARAVAMYFEEP